MSEESPAYVTRDIGQVRAPMPVMARRRQTDAHARLREAEAALDASRGVHLRIGRSIQACRLTLGLQDLQTISGQADEAISCLSQVKRLAAEARTHLEGVQA